MHISIKNKKLGSIASISLSLDSCIEDAPCKKVCYARRMVARRKSIEISWMRNYIEYLQDAKQYFHKIYRWLTIHKPKFFRWHVGGDIPRAYYLYMLKEVAEDTPGVKHLIFTKTDYDFSKLPENLHLRQSLWPGWGNPQEGIRKAWMQDGTETRIPENAIECPGSCVDCSLCWRSDRDVYFKKH